MDQPSPPSERPGGFEPSPPSEPSLTPEHGRHALGRFAPLLVAVLVVLALVTAYFSFFHGPEAFRRRARSGGAPGKTGVAVFPLRPTAGAPEVAWYGQAVFEFLPLALENNPDLRVLTPERLHDLAKGNLPADLGLQRALARKGRADYLLRGEVSGNPGSVTLTASWVEVSTGREANRWVVEGVGAENLGRKLDDLLSRLRGALGLAAPPPSDPRLLSLLPVKEGPTRSYLEASALLAKGDPAGCLTRLDEAMGLPDFYLAQYLQAIAAARRGDPRRAASAASPLAKLSRPLPARVALMAPAILALYASGNPRNAVAPLESFLARFPDEKHPLAWLGAIEVLLLNEPDRAMAHLKKSLALDPNNPDAQRLLAQAMVEAGHPTDAAPLLESYLRGRADDDRARILLAEALRRSGRREEARGQAEKVLSRRPEQIQAVELLGNLLLEEGQAPAASALYTKLAGSPQPSVRAEAEVLLARTRLLEGRFQEAVRHYRAASSAAARAGNQEAQGRQLLELGAVQSSLGRGREALVTLAEIRGLETSVDADLAMINVIVSQKQFETARRMFQEQTRRWEGRVSPAVQGRLRDSLEGTIALEEARFQEAVSRLRAALETQGEEPPASEALGRAYLGAGEYARAEAVFRKIIENPGRFAEPIRYVLSLARLGEACERQGKREDALRAYREALKWWGSADYSLPEIVKARQALTRLGR